MSEVADFFGGGSVIGDIAYFPETVAELTRGKQKWLRSGVLGLQSAYPKLEKVPHMRQFGVRVTKPVNDVVRRMATNGSGTYLAVDDTTKNQLLRSTNHGLTWVTSGGIPFNVTDIAYCNDRFVLVGNDASSIKLVTTTNGTDFGATKTAAVASAAIDTARCAWNGTRIVVTVSTTANAATAYSEHPFSSLTAVSLPAASLGASGQPLQVISGGGFVIAGDTTSRWFRSTDGASWVQFTGPAAMNASAQSFYGGGVGFFYQGGSTVTYYATNDGGATVGTYSIVGQALSFPQGLSIAGIGTFNGTHWVMPLAAANTSSMPLSFLYTETPLDVNSWKRAGANCVGNAPNQSMSLCASGNRLVGLNGVLSADPQGFSAASFPAVAEYCGMPFSNSLGVTATAGVNAYVYAS